MKPNAVMKSYAADILRTIDDSLNGLARNTLLGPFTYFKAVHWYTATINSATIIHSDREPLSALVNTLGVPVLAAGYFIHRFLKRRKNKRSKAVAPSSGPTAAAQAQPLTTSVPVANIESKPISKPRRCYQLNRNKATIREARLEQAKARQDKTDTLALDADVEDYDPQYEDMAGLGFQQGGTVIDAGAGQGEANELFKLLQQMGVQVQAGPNGPVIQAPEGYNEDGENGDYDDEDGEYGDYDDEDGDYEDYDDDHQVANKSSSRSEEMMKDMMEDMMADEDELVDDEHYVVADGEDEDEDEGEDEEKQHVEILI
eukprot:gene21687-28710_t